MTRFAVALSMLVLLPGPALAQSAPKILRYVSQSAEKAYMREGPTYQHRVLWEYRHKGYPFAVIAQFDTWRRVKAADGTTGWMAAAMLTDRRTVLVTGKGRVKIFEKPDGGKVVALAEPGATAPLRACARNACQIRSGDVDGWIAKDRVWGVTANETFDKVPRRH